MIKKDLHLLDKGKNPIKGGKGDKKSLSSFNPKELEMGIKHEMEHTPDREKAADIARDHLSENPSYYTDLKAAKVESIVKKFLESRSGWEVTGYGDDSPDHYYHTTERKNIRKILKHGLNPKLRREHKRFGDNLNDYSKDKVFVAKNTRILRDLKPDGEESKFATLRIHKNLVNKDNLYPDLKLSSTKARFSQQPIKADPVAYKKNKLPRAKPGTFKWNKSDQGAENIEWGREEGARAVHRIKDRLNKRSPDNIENTFPPAHADDIQGMAYKAARAVRIGMKKMGHLSKDEAVQTLEAYIKSKK